MFPSLRLLSRCWVRPCCFLRGFAALCETVVARAELGRLFLCVRACMCLCVTEVDNVIIVVLCHLITENTEVRTARRSADAVQFNKAVVLLGIIFRKLSTNI